MSEAKVPDGGEEKRGERGAGGRAGGRKGEVRAKRDKGLGRERVRGRQRELERYCKTLLVLVTIIFFLGRRMSRVGLP